MVNYKSCIKCGKKARFSDAFGEFVCYNQKCKFREHIDTPQFDFRVQRANYWWNALKNDEKIKIMINSDNKDDSSTRKGE